MHQQTDKQALKAYFLPLSFFLSIVTFFFQNTRIEVVYNSEAEFVSRFADFLTKFRIAGSGISIEVTLLTLLFAIALYQTFIKRKWVFSRSALLVSLLFGFCNVCGLSIHTMGSLLYLNANAFQWLLSVCRMLSTAFIMYLALLWLFYAFDRQQQQRCLAEPSSKRPLLNWMRRHNTLTCFVLILLCWSPYYISFYPGGFTVDSYNQLLCAYSLVEPTSKSPIYHSYLVGGLVWLGRAIFGSNNAGLYLFTIFQTAVSAAIYAYALTLIRKMDMSKWFFRFSFFFYALTPILATYAVTELKDPLFAAFTALFVTQTIALLLQPAKSDSIKSGIFYALSAVCLGLCRNGALYLVLPAALAWGMIGLKRKKRSGAARGIAPFYPCFGLCVAVGCLLALTKLMLPVLGVTPGTKGDALSLPFQQTARYVREYKYSVTEEEKRAIDAVMDYDNLRTLYQPDFADPVIGTYRLYGQSNEGEALKNYFSVWLKMGHKHPLTYIEATLCNTYPFYTFYPKYETGGINYLYIVDIAKSGEYFSFQMPDQLAAARNTVQNLAQAFASVPLVNAVNDAAVYTWLLFGIIAYWMHRREYRKLLAATVPFLIFVACIGAPVAHLRYYLPVCASMPVLLAFCCQSMPCSVSSESSTLLRS